jgi:hypothetical protein
MQIVVPTLAVKHPVISRISRIARGYCSALEPFLTGLPQNPVRPAVECLADNIPALAPPVMVDCKAAFRMKRLA